MRSYQKDALSPADMARGGGSQQPGPASTRERMLWRVWEEVRRGAGHFGQGRVPLPVSRLGQFVHGLCLPVQVARAVFADRKARRRYLKVCTLQAAVILALAVVFTGSGKQAVESVGPEEWTEQVEEEAALPVDEAALQADEALRQAEKDREVEAAVEGAAKAGTDAKQVRKAARPGKRTVSWLVYWAALLSSLHIAQWFVIALSRDYHTALTREVSLLIGLEPEDAPLIPRLRLNLGWLRTKLVRRARGLGIFACGVPVLWVLKALLPWGGELFTAMLSAWGAWWCVVFTAGESSRAWAEPAPREPWFLRGWNWLTAQVTPLHWPLGVYGSLWTSFTRSVFAPAACVERQPWVFSGLAVAQVFVALPLVKCFLRPLFPVAATHLLVAGSGEGSASPRPSARGVGSAPPAGGPSLPPPAGSPTT